MLQWFVRKKDEEEEKKLHKMHEIKFILCECDMGI